MGNLTGKKPSATYKSLLHLSGTDNQELTTSLHIVEDGAGADSALKVSLASGGAGISVDNLQITGNSIISTDSGGHIIITPNAAGDVQLSADTVRVGDNNSDATITTYGTCDLTLSTNAGSDSGTIKIYDAADGNIDITPDGTGEVNISKVDIDAGAITGTTIAGSTGSFTTLATSSTITASGGFNLAAGIFKGHIVSVASDTDNLSATSVFIVKLNTASGNVALSGFTGGVAGQVVYVLKPASAYTATLEHDHVSTQRIFTRSAANEGVGQSGVKATNPRGGWILVCDGTHWYSIGR